MSVAERARPPKLGLAARAERRRLGRAAGMPPATHRGVLVEHDLVVHAADGTPLRTDHYAAADAGGAAVLIRTPYGRAGLAGVATFLAERGHHVVVQSCRGTFGSGGDGDPLHDEPDDGRAALEWVRDRPWSDGTVHTWGFSYFGVTQWAMYDLDHPPEAMVIGLSARRFDDAVIYPGGGFAMETAVVWCTALALGERSLPVRLWRLARAAARVRRGSSALPPREAVHRATGWRPGFFEDWLDHDAPDDPWWFPLHFGEGTRQAPPVTLLAGWQDLFLLGGFADYEALRERGAPVRLLVGDWTHHDGAEAGPVSIRELLRGMPSPTAPGPVPVPVPSEPAPISIEIAPGHGWRDLRQWPPASDPITLHPGETGRLTTTADALAHALPLRYDPTDPTPNAGGRSLNPFSAGRLDQRERERRDDVLVFTGEPISAPLEIVGTPGIEVSFTSSIPTADIFVRLCDVDPRGRSTTVADGYRRITAHPGDTGARRTLALPLAPVAYRFAPGHRLRLQISAGAHPLHLRHPGVEAPIGDVATLVPYDLAIIVGGDEPTRLRLPRTP